MQMVALLNSTAQRQLVIFMLCQALVLETQQVFAQFLPYLLVAEERRTTIQLK
jgi:hypothetical protein